MCSMSILEVTCPVCDEVLELSDADRAELSVGDAVVGKLVKKLLLTSFSTSAHLANG